MEDGNVDEHRNYLSLEEEKRQRAKVVRTAVKGPLLRWVSRAEEVACGSSAQPSSIPLGAQATGSFYTMEEGVSRYGWAYTGWAVGSANGSPDAPFALNPAVPASSVRGTEIHGAPSAASWPPIHPGFIPVLWPPPNSGPGVEVVPSQIPQPAVPRKEKVTRNYLIHELGQTEQTPWPTWKESMEAIFGNHVRWEDLRVYTGKGRPLGMASFSCLPAFLSLMAKRPRSETHPILSSHRSSREIYGPTHGRAICEPPRIPNADSGTQARLRMERSRRMLCGEGRVSGGKGSRWCAAQRGHACANGHRFMTTV